MERYYENPMRKQAHENQLEHGYYATAEQLHDICRLLAEGKGPDGRFSDAECCLWEVIKTELHIETR